ncbi:MULTISPECIES: oxidoreductase [unclassified Nocardioides]|uniref:oxidoreductase n=1 Tax=unclassified Nocardioides TaxID=2615069 RepID=UPI0007030C60|nr:MULTISPECIES: oxidoreductase [unclassified Nocardioides]KRC52879.1 short-chain dehydrogenase [Nocardioides sp. Root79]KRC72409.1 short-chain dehydrogenase [Nocardioides sp. Root240]
MKWNVADLPDQTGRTVIVTGPTLGGLGHHTALELARRGARVVLAGRNPAKVEETVVAIRKEVPEATLEALHLDLASLASVRAAAAAAEQIGSIDVLVNNAGVMGTPYSRTADGLEIQMATNHFGPFLLTGLLLPQLVQSGDGRVVNVASLFHTFAGKAPLGNPREQSGRYHRWKVYGQTKLANLYATAELDRRLTEADLPVRALAAHPGFAGTHLAANGQYGRSSGGIATILDAGIKAVSQSAAAGAWPSLMAATADLPGNTFVGPSGPRQMIGPPRIVGRSRLARNEEAARKLWEISEETVDLQYP